MEKTGAGTGRAHRDINGRRRSAGAGGRRGHRGRVDAGLDRLGDGELVALREDDVDVGAVDAADLVAPFGVGVAGDLNGVGQIGRGDVQGQRHISRRPGDKVPKVETEVGGIGVDAGPPDGHSGPRCVGDVGCRTGDVDGRSQRAKRNNQGDHGAHHVDPRVLIGLILVGMGFRIYWGKKWSIEQKTRLKTNGLEKE